MYDTRYADDAIEIDETWPGQPDPQPGEPGYEEWLAYEEHMAHEASIFRTRQRRRCYDCETPAGSPAPIGAMRRVVREVTVNKLFDPTVGYKLTCGHVTIDC